jgi:hypothetical protein
VTAGLARYLTNRATLSSMPARANPESPGFKKLVAAARAGAFEAVHLIATRDLRFGEIWLEPGERFHCGKGLAAFLIDDGAAERVVNPS